MDDNDNPNAALMMFNADARAHLALGGNGSSGGEDNGPAEFSRAEVVSRLRAINASGGNIAEAIAAFEAD